MIRLERVRTVDAVPTSFRGATPRNRLVRLMKQVRDQLESGDAVKPTIDSLWKVAKEQLLAESHQKCAYCETPTSVIAFGDVEHYRPKSVYWWLAYVYDNYLASCTLCNQKYKGSEFEIEGPQMPGPVITANQSDQTLKELAKTAIPDPLKLAAVEQFVAAHRAERALGLNPYLDNPEAIFAWRVDDIKEVTVIANPDVPEANKFVEAGHRMFGINRLQLRRQRYVIYRSYNLARRVLDEAGASDGLKSDARELVLSMTAPESAYAAMIRYFERQRGPIV